MRYPKISIVTPSFNQAHFIEATIQSVLKQNYPNLEYIIIDGGSTDGSVDIIKKYEKLLTFWISEKDSGQSEALNKGFSKANGEIFAYLNSDDLLNANTLIRVAELFQNNNDYDLVYANANLIDPNAKSLGLCIALPFNLKEHLAGVFAIPQQSAFWKRNVYEKIGGFNKDNHTCMDGEFFARAYNLGFQFGYFDEIWASFRIHSDSKTGSKNSELVNEYHEMQKKYFLELDSNFKLNFKFRSLQLFYRIKYIPFKLIRLIKFHLNIYK